MDPYRYKAPREVAESERLFQRDLRALRVVDDERDLRPTILRREDVDGMHVDPRASEAATKDLLRRVGHGTSRVRSRGNRIASRMFGRSRSFWTNRSRPKPQPPCGGMPYRNALR